MSQTETKPLTPNATRDWQLGEIAAIENRAPYPPPSKNDILDRSAWSAGFHQAYRRIHGKPWIPPPPGDLPSDAIVLYKEPIATSLLSSNCFGDQLRVILAKYSAEHGVTDFGTFDHTEFQGSAEQGTYAVGYGISIILKNPSDRNTPVRVFISVDHIKGEYNLRPKLDESNFISELKRLNLEKAMITAERRRRIENAELIESELNRVFGPVWHVSFKTDGNDIGSLQCFNPSNDQIEAMKGILKPLPSATL